MAPAAISFWLERALLTRSFPGPAHLWGLPHADRSIAQPDRPYLGRILVRRHLEPPRSDRADHLPALPAPARRPADPRGEQSRPARAADRAPHLPRGQGRDRPPIRRPALVSLQEPVDDQEARPG